MTLEGDVGKILAPSGGSGHGGELPSESSFSFSPTVRNEKRDMGLSVVKVAELLAEPVEPVPWLVEGLLPHGGLSILAGKPKAGKSTLARCMALAIARGDTVIGRASVAGPVVYLGLEDKRSEIAAHFRAMGAGNEPMLVHSGPAPRQSDVAIAQLDYLIGQHRPTLAIIDTLLRFVRVRDASDYAGMTDALNPLLDLAHASGCHVLCVCHSPKMKREGLDAILGSVAIGGTCDTGLILDRKPSGQRIITAIQRYGTDLPETLLELDESTRMVVAAGSVVERESGQLETAILEAMADSEHKETGIRKAVGGDGGKVGTALRRMFEAGRVTRTGRGVAGCPYLYRAAHSAE